LSVELFFEVEGGKRVDQAPESVSSTALLIVAFRSARDALGKLKERERKKKFKRLESFQTIVPKSL